MREDIAKVVESVNSLKDMFVDFRNEQREMVGGLMQRVNTMDSRQAALSERLSNMTVFQTTLTVVIGAVASYLGINRK